MGDRRTGRDLDLYRVLGVSSSADADELRRAYRRRLRQLHPDTRQTVDDTADDLATAEGRDRLALAQVLHAYQVLRDPARRARYDAERAARSTRPAGPSPGAAGSRPETGRQRTPRPAHNRRAGAGVVIKIGPVRIDLGLGSEEL